MKTCAVLVPVFGRPAAIRPLVESHNASRQSSRIYFICNHDDPASIREASKVLRRDPFVVPWEGGAYADWAKKLNFTWPLVDEEWRLHAADDVRFHVGWLDAGLAVALRFEACVIGTNDMANPRVKLGHHATHQLVHRDYWECGTIDEAGKVVTEVYHHNFVDDEFVHTAMARSTYASARGSCIEHLHPDWGTAPDDATYQLGKSQFGRDAVLFQSRRPLWEPALRRSRPVPIV